MTRKVKERKTDPHSNNKILRRNKSSFICEIRKHLFLYAMTIPGILFFLVFSYLPMGGLIIAFQKFNVRQGFLSPFCGLDNFKFFFNPSIFGGLSKAAVNTLYLNTLFIVTTTTFSVILAIAFSQLRNKKYSKITQTLSLLPYFISWAIVSLFLNSAMFNSDQGILTKILAEFDIKVNFFQADNLWPGILLFLKIWQGAGYGSIVYLATITGIDPQVMEASEIDGATKWQKIRYITLPLLKTTIVLMTLFSVGRIFYGDFGMIYALIGDNSALYSTTDVIDTYVYRAMRNLGQYGLSTAIGMVQSLLGFIFVITANGLARKVEPDSAIF